METQIQAHKQSISVALQATRDLIVDTVYNLKIDFDELPSERKISELKKTPYHNRVIIPEKYKSLHQSLTEFSFIGAIFINEETNTIIDGWYRKEIWGSLGHVSIPCFSIRCNAEQEQALYLRLNTQAATFDFTNYGLTLPKVNLISDYGFTVADLHVFDPTNTSFEKPQRSETNGLKKLSALLNNNTYVRLTAIKEETKVENWSDVIEILIENYENIQH
ncbi:MAG TPA: hypothetical protein VL442_06755 [Mucilaginibacter sp.]|jgi:hypothetical protein|nr:hypothetical protein [Mucilaginibacter sp.]